MTDNDALRLTAVLGNYPHTLPLKEGQVSSPRLAFEFVDMKPTHTAFKPMVRELRYDVSEMAIVTFLQAKAYGKPLALLPTAMLSRFQQPLLVYNAERGELRPADLPGRRVGVRAYSQTTGAWIRGILADEYGVDPGKIRWVTFEDAHVAEYADPPEIERAPAGKKLLDMLLAGEIDAAIGEFPNQPALRPVIPDSAAAAQAWYERHRTVPVKHMVVVK
jgi:4,5-dihydroxyphthalate decarboxylase